MLRILIISTLAAIISADTSVTTLNLPNATFGNATTPWGGRRLLVLENGDVNFAALFSSVTRTLARYERLAAYASHPSSDESTLHKRQITTHLADCVISGVDTGYSSEVRLGGTRFNMLVDTGSADIVVPGPKCDAAAGCANLAKYGDTGTDLNGGQEVEIQYNVDSGKGHLVADDVYMGGVTAKNSTILSLVSSSGIGTSQFDGVFGLGGQEISITNQPTFFQNLITQKAVSAPEFGVSLGRTFSGSAIKSSLTLGPTDPKVYNGPIFNIPVYNSSGWKIPVAYVSVDGKPVGQQVAATDPAHRSGFRESSGGLATIDTGSTLMITSKANADAIFAAIPGSQPISFGGSSTQGAPSGTASGAAAQSSSDAGSGQSYYYGIPCDLPRAKVPQFTFSLTGDLYDGIPYARTGHGSYEVDAFRTMSFPIHPRDFNVGSIAAASASAAGTQCDVNNNTLSLADSANLCVSSIMGAGSGFDPDKGQSLYVLGDEWMKGRYTRFQYSDAGVPEFVGFGRLR